MLDLLLKGGLVFDGTGAPPARADVGIAGDRIACIAPAIDEPARETRDVGGLWIAPGFVDIHTHYDVEVEIAPGLAESVRHGVTSVVMGNCSLSVTVGDPQALADIFLRVENLPAPLVRRWLAGAVSWDSPQAYLAHLRALPLGPNVAPLVGHSALRAAVMGLERSLHARATESELTSMRALANEALDAGCIGISVDMVHWHKVGGVFAGRSVPSHYADAREYRMLADVCRMRDAVFQVTPNPQNPFSFLLILGLATGLFRPPLRLTVLSALDMADHPHLWRLFPAATFVIGSALAAVAGVMVSAYYGLAHYYMGFLLGLKAFSAAVLGGIGNLGGAMLGGLLLGLIESFGAGYIGDLTGGFLGSHYQDVFAFFVLIAVLVFRPSGLLGARVVERA